METETHHQNIAAWHLQSCTADVASSTTQQKYLVMCRVASSIAIHHYVNNLDVVPRLLGANRLNSLLAHVAKMMPAGASGNLAKSLASVMQRAGAFVPFGQYHVVLGASMQSVDAATDQAALLFTWKHAVEILTKVAPDMAWTGMSCFCVISECVWTCVSTPALICCLRSST